MFRVLLMAALCAALQDVDALMSSAQRKLDQRDFRGAVEDYTRVLEADPRRADAYLARGKAHAGMNSVVDALDDFTRATEVDPKLAEAWMWRGRVQLARKEYGRAVRDLASALELGARDGRIHQWRGECLFQLYRFEEAEESCTKALELIEPGALLYTLRAGIRCRRSNFRGSISDATRAIQLDPKHEPAFWCRGLAYFGMQSWANALRDFRRHAELASVPSDALWIFLSRSRLGERDAAVAETRDFIKRSRDSGNLWKILPYLTDDLPEEEFLKLAEGNDAKRAALHFFQGQKARLAGRPDEAVDHFRKACAAEGTMSDDVILLSRAELDHERRQATRLLAEGLEASLRTLPPYEATYGIDVNGKAAEDLGIRGLTWTVDSAREELLVAIDRDDEKSKQPSTLILHLRGGFLQMWSAPAGQDGRYVRMDLAFVRDLFRFGGDVRRLIPADPGAKEEGEAKPVPSVGMNLEGKPSKDGEGTLRFYSGLGGHPSSWLKEARTAEDASGRVDGDAVVFEIPSRRKTIVVDRKTGILRLLEAKDYDGTPRALTLRSFRRLDRFPAAPERPASLKPMPFDVREYRNQMAAQEDWLETELADAFQNWDRIVQAGHGDAALALFRQWAARYVDGLYAYAVRSLAGQAIQRSLDLGTPPADLLKEGAKEPAAFAKAFGERRKEVLGFLGRQLADLSFRTETGLIESLIDSRMHETIRATLKQAFDPELVERVRREAYGDRLEELYREELATRTKL